MITSPVENGPATAWLESVYDTEHHDGVPVDTVVIPHSTPADLDQTAAMVTEAGGRVHAEIVDVRDLSAVQAAADRGADRFGGLDIVCATAGITSRASGRVMSSAMLSFELFGHTHNVVEAHQRYFDDAMDRSADLVGLP